MKWIKERVIGRSDTDQLGNDAMGREEREERRRGDYRTLKFLDNTTFF